MERLFDKELLGGGDIKLLFVTGIYLGWEKNLWALLFASIIGIAIGMMMLKRKTKDQQADSYFPFGPAIAAGAMITMIA